MVVVPPMGTKTGRASKPSIIHRFVGHFSIRYKIVPAKHTDVIGGTVPLLYCGSGGPTFIRAEEAWSVKSS